MIRHLASLAFLAALTLAATPARAQDNRVARLAAPFVDDDVLVLIHVDLSKLNMAGFEKAVAEVAAAANVPEPLRKDAAGLFRGAAAPLGLDAPAFVKAGGRHVFLLVNPADVPLSPPPLVAPVEQGGNANTVMAIVRRWRNPRDEVDVIGGAVVAGTAQQLHRIRRIKPALRPGLAEAIVASGGEAAAHVLLLPTKDVKRVVETISPTLPKQVGGGPVTVVTHNVDWAAAGFEIGDAPSARVVIQSPDPTAAANLLKYVNDVPKHVRGEVNVEGPLLAQLLERLSFRQEQSRLTVSLDKAGASAVLGALVQPLAAARERANRVRSASNMRMILQGVMLYANDHKGAWPDDLKVLIKEADLNPVVFRNPRNPEADPAYVYLKPADPAKGPGDLIVLYEDPKTVTEGVNVGFWDGHVDFMTTQSFNESLAKQQRAAPPPPAK